MKPESFRFSPICAVNFLIGSGAFRKLAGKILHLPLEEKITTLHCLGDSHLRYFKWVACHQLWYNTRFNFFDVPGATAMGMANPNSKTNALKLFSEHLSALDNIEYVLLSLGEVDCGFVIWYRARKYGVSVKEQMDTSFENYVGFIENIVSLHGARIIIASVPLPTIQDGQDWGEVANLRKEVKATLKERTDLTIRYNEILRSYCEKEGHYFLDYTSFTMNPETGLIADRFLERNPLDHHLASSAVGPVLAKELKRAGFS